MTDSNEARPTIEISVTGGPHSGKTLVTTLIGRALAEYGMEHVLIENLDGDYHSRLAENPGVEDLTQPQPDIIVRDLNGAPSGDPLAFQYHHQADSKIMVKTDTLNRIKRAEGNSMQGATEVIHQTDDKE